MDFFTTLGRGGFAGVVLGLMLVTWIRPVTIEGQILLVLIVVVVCVLVTAVFRALFGKNASDDKPD